MVLPSGETSRNIQVPSSTSNSIVRRGPGSGLAEVSAVSVVSAASWARRGGEAAVSNAANARCGKDFMDLLLTGWQGASGGIGVLLG